MGDIFWNGKENGEEISSPMDKSLGKNWGL